MLGLDTPRVAAIVGDDVTEVIRANPQHHVAQGPVTRYELPKMRALNFVIENALGGGVTVSLAMDAHGKTLSYIMQDIELSDQGLG